MIRCAILCLLFGSVAWGQATSAEPTKPTGAAQGAASGGPAPAAAAQLPAAPSTASGASASKPPDPSVVPLDAAVITIDGLCDNPSVTAAGDCKTVVTRADFEKIISTVQPNMPLPQQRQLANNYATVLMMSREAHRLGLDQGPDFDERMRLARLEVLMQLVIKNVRNQSSEVPDKDVADFYQAHLAQYEQASVLQLYVPLSKQPGPAAPKTPGAAAAAPKTQAENAAIMKKEAEALRARAAAGEDFTKLQSEAFQYAGLKTPPPDTHLTNLRKSSLSASRAAVMDLKPDEISQVIVDPTGFFIYKMEKKEAAPLDQVRSEIMSQVKAQHTQTAMQSLQHLGKPQFEDKYFGAAPPSTGSPGAVPARVPSRSPVPAAPPATSPTLPKSSSGATTPSPGPN